MSRRRRAFIFLSAFMAVVAVVWLDNSCYSSKQQRQGVTSPPSANSDVDRYHSKRFTVTKIVDGDTIDIDIGDGTHQSTRIRLWGVDTPETKKPGTAIMYFGPEATEFTSKLTAGKEVTIYLDTQNRTRGKYGRLLAYVQLADRRFLNELLLLEGFAYADLRFRHSFYHKYIQLESTARSRKRGLWKKVTHEQLPEWLQKKKPNLGN